MVDKRTRCYWGNGKVSLPIIPAGTMAIIVMMVTVVVMAVAMMMRPVAMPVGMGAR